MTEPISAEQKLVKATFLEILTCTGHATHLRTQSDQAFQNWADYSDYLLRGGELADINVEHLFPKGAHWIRCSLITKSDLEPDFTKATILADIFLACPHTIAVQQDEAVKSRLVLPAGVQA